MKKTIFIAFLMLIIASPVINAITFKKYSGERAFYMPELTSTMDENVYEVHNYEIDFPTDGSSLLKAIILKNVLGVNTSNLDKATEQFLSTFVDEESSDSPQLINYTPEGGWAVQQSSATGKLKSQTSDLITYEYERYFHLTGAAHGMYGVSYINFYIPQQKDLTISDLLLTSKKSAINKAVRSNARKVVDALYSDDTSDIEYSETFYLSNKGITFVYQPYEIGPYMSGVIEITVPKAQLTGCLTALGKKLIK